MPWKTLSGLKVQFLKNIFVSFTKKIIKKSVSEYEMFKILQVVEFTKEHLFGSNKLSLQHCKDATLNQSGAQCSDFHFIKMSRMHFHSML